MRKSKPNLSALFGWIAAFLISLTHHADPLVVIFAGIIATLEAIIFLLDCAITFCS